MDFKVLIADSAIADLKEIVEFFAEDNPEAAIRVGEKLLGHALSLATLPDRFRLHDRRRGIRKMPVSPFLIYYKCKRITFGAFPSSKWQFTASRTC